MISTLPAGLVDLAIAFLLVEAALLLAYRRLTGRGPAARDALPNLAAGLCLMLAARAAFLPEPGLQVAAWLLAAGAAHAADMARRWLAAAR